MPLKFWDKAFTMAVYLINRTPNKVLNFETPLEHLFHTKPNYMSLRVFGCTCWPNLRPYNKHKLDFWSKQCVFLGYSSQHNGFKCLDISEGRIYISRDVVFDETVYHFAKLHPNAGARLHKDISLLPSFDSTGVCLTDGSTFVDLSNQGGENVVENLVLDGEHSDHNSEEADDQNCYFIQEEVHVAPEADLGQDSALDQASPGWQQGATPSSTTPISSEPISSGRASDAEPVHPEWVDVDSADVIDQ
jgi:hypothetical protein